VASFAQYWRASAVKNHPRKPAARRSDCIGKLGCRLQTGRGAACELVLLSGIDRYSINPHQLPRSYPSLAKAKGIAIAAITVPAVM
jgi:hypothetical protein